MPEKREHSTHIRLCESADSALEFMAASLKKEKSVLAADIVTRVLLGEVHELRVAAERFLRVGTTGNNRE